MQIVGQVSHDLRVFGPSTGEKGTYQPDWFMAPDMDKGFSNRIQVQVCLIEVAGEGLVYCRAGIKEIDRANRDPEKFGEDWTNWPTLVGILEPGVKAVEWALAVAPRCYASARADLIEWG